MTKVKFSWIHSNIKTDFPLNIVYEHLLLSSFNAAISGLQRLARLNGLYGGQKRKTVYVGKVNHHRIGRSEGRKESVEQKEHGKGRKEHASDLTFSRTPDRLQRHKGSSSARFTYITILGSFAKLIADNLKTPKYFYYLKPLLGACGTPLTRFWVIYR